MNLHSFLTEVQKASLGYRRNIVISTAPIGSVYEHIKTGLRLTKVKECANPCFVECSYINPHTGLEARDTVACSALRLISGSEKVEAAAGKSDGSSADYYTLPANSTQLQDLISHRNMNAQMGEIFRATYRYGLASHSDQLRDAKKIKFYAEAEIKRLEKLNVSN